MRWDWEKFCKEYQIEKGSESTKDDIYVRCPYCFDHGHHLGLKLSPTQPFWHCWRCNRGGHQPFGLVAALLNISFDAASKLVKESTQTNPDDFDNLFEPKESPVKKSKLILPSNFRLVDRGRSAERFVRYLSHQRGFDQDALDVASTFKLRYTLSGKFAHRLIYPLYEDQKLIAWTARAIGQAEVRYLTEGDIKTTVGNFDSIMSTQYLKLFFIVEGPIDMMKLDFYGAPVQARTTCTFGTAVSHLQMAKLAKIISTKKPKKTIVLFDEDAVSAASKLADHLQGVTGAGVHSRLLQTTSWSGVKDPADLARRDVQPFINSLSIK
jgi:5S rRNA maturation endonuclease (ribonuclease M5)